MARKRKNRILYLDGADELDAAFKRIGDRLTGVALREAATEGAQVIADEARRRAPKETGALAEGIHVEPGRLQNGRATMHIGYSAKQWYGRLVEKGTKYIAAKPFLRPAFDAKAPEATNVMNAALRRLLRGVL